MNLTLDTKIAINYTSGSQKARILTEAWVLSEVFCPNCGDDLSEYTNNKPVADFYCQRCIEDFELKSKKGKIGSKVAAGAYSQMMSRINSPLKPHFFFMSYENDKQKVKTFFVVPKYFFTSEIIEKRNPLAKGAKRAGWVGSNILFSKIPKAGQIFYVENEKINDKKPILESWNRTLFLKEIKKDEAKGWILDIMNCIDFLGKKEFNLNDLYSFEKDLSTLHPKNKNVRPKIRQQLQILRDKGYIKFVGAGNYTLK